MLSSTMQRQRFLFIALGLLTLWRWALLPTLDLSPEESFIALRAQHGWHGWHGWQEGGPLLPLLVVGSSEFGVRFLAPLLALLTSLAVWRFTRGLFDPMIAGWAVVILNVLPSFNLAAISLTTGTLLFFFTAVSLFSLRWALLHAHPLHWGWWITAACAAASVCTAPPAFSMLGGIACALALPKRLRHHLRAPGFFIIAAAWVAAVIPYLIWQRAHEWPTLESSNWRPYFALIPNFFRLAVLTSPLMLTLFVLVSRLIWQNATQLGMRALPLGFAIPLACADFLYGPWDAWPNVGSAAWMLPAAVLLAHQGTVFGALPSEQKISLRTIAVILAALQSVFLMQSDLPRSLGIPWRFARALPQQSIYPHLFSADPSTTMRGWREGSKLLTAALQPDWFAIASDWRIAAALEQHMETKVRVHAMQDGSWSHPYAYLPRYDQVSQGVSLFRGKSAIFITDDPAAIQPPAAIQQAFQSTELLSIARIMHAGNEVRWLKIFACHDYHPPDF